MIQSEGTDLIQVSKTLRDAFEKGRQETIEKMLRQLFARRLGRTLSDNEQRVLVARARSLDPEEVQDRALALEGEALAAWLLDPNAK